MDPVYYPPAYVFKIHFNIILQVMPWSSKRCFLHIFLSELFTHVLPFPVIPHSSSTSYFNHTSSEGHHYAVFSTLIYFSYYVQYVFCTHLFRTIILYILTLWYYNWIPCVMRSWFKFKWRLYNKGHTCHFEHHTAWQE